LFAYFYLMFSLCSAELRIRFLLFSMRSSLCSLLFFFLTPAFAAVVPYHLVIDTKEVNFSGRERTALAINDRIPGPTLRFRVGDTAEIVVENRLAKEDMSLHWHGLLVPNAQDGVPYLTSPPIAPGESRTFRFPLRHAGTYWFHSHTGLQEQRGVYGSIVVEPDGVDSVKADRDYVVVLSDWTDERPKEVMRTLMRGSEWYGIEKGNAQSLFGAWRKGALRDYVDRERSRMPAMDVSDVAYDAFLLNGAEQQDLPARPGERIRLRIINAGASSYFYLHSASGPLTVVATDGMDVEPVEIPRILIGMAETYDVLFTVPSSGRWEFRATAQDNSGHSSLFIGPDGAALTKAASLPSPELYSMDDMLVGALDEGESIDLPRPPAPYPHLRSRTTTDVAPEPGAGTRTLELRLTGDMRRYLWSINGRTLAEDSTIPVREGEVLRLKMINDTMMHHPMHLHGHFFRLLNGAGDHAPLKHTVDVPPMGTRTIEFLADEYGDWLFHCHLLYHMDAGMARILSYRAAEDAEHKPEFDPNLDNPWFYFAQGMVLNNMTMGKVMAMTGREDFYATWDYGFGHDHHDEYEADVGWSHYIDPNLSAGLGYRLTNEHHAENRAFANVSYRLPYLVASRLELDSEGDVRLALGKEIPITQRLSIDGDLHYDTGSGWEWAIGASFVLTKELSLAAHYNSDHGAGVGVGFRF